MRILFVLFCFFIFSCEDQLEIPDIDFQNEMVIYGTVSPQQQVWLQITKLLDPRYNYKEEDILLKEVEVAVYEDSLFLGNLREGEKGNYFSDSLDLIEGHEYKIIASHEDFPSASTVVTIPPALPKFEVEFIDTASFNSPITGFKRFCMFDITVEERPILSDTTFFYQLEIKNHPEEGWNIQFTTNKHLDIDIDDPYFCGLFGRSNIYVQNIYSTICRSENEFKTRIYIEYQDIENEEGDLYFSLSQVEPDLVDFENYYLIDDFVLLFVPYEVLEGNIEGGQGIITGKNLTEHYVPYRFEREERWFSSKN